MPDVPNAPDATATDVMTMTPDAGPFPPDPCIAAGSCPLGQWVNVAPAGLGSGFVLPYGPGAIVRDPSRPMDLYIGAGPIGLWKSSDYGNTWVQINAMSWSSPIGVPIAIAGTSPATL